MSIDALISQMQALGGELRQADDRRAAFHNTYLRTTQAVAEALRAGRFADPGWVERWDVVFAQLYLDALAAAREGGPVPLPWEVAFGAAASRPGIPPLRLVLLGMNAHINYDLPQALLAVISDGEFGDPAIRTAREADHRRIDDVLAARVGAEDEELKQLQMYRSVQDMVLAPLNRMATRRLLREARAKVWANAIVLSQARQQGQDALDRRLAELEELSAARVADLVRPGPVLLRLASGGGFGVVLNGASPAASTAPAAKPPSAPRRRSGEPGPLRTFSPLAVGRLECALWVAYYRRDWARFLVLSLRVVHRTFGMDWLRTIHGAWLVLRANQLWAGTPNDPAGARRCMRRFYALLRLTHGAPADPRRAARLEVDWWAVHRAREREDAAGAEALVTALARLYACLYGTGEDAVRPAAEFRARAMDISDQWAEEGCDLASPLLPTERALLVRSYAALLAAVHRG